MNTEKRYIEDKGIDYVKGQESKTLEEIIGGKYVVIDKLKK